MNSSKKILVEIAPDLHTETGFKLQIPKFAICEMIRCECETDEERADNPAGFVFKPVIRHFINSIPIDQKSLDAYEFSISNKTIRMLGKAGFIRLFPVTPQTLHLDLESWFLHEARVKADPLRFWNQERRAQYSQAREAINGAS